MGIDLTPKVPGCFFEIKRSSMLNKHEDEVIAKLENKLRRERMKLFKFIVALIIFVISVVLCIIWYDVKLLLIFFLFQWATNISNALK